MSKNYDRSSAISPLDGRYGAKLRHLSEYFSEFALMRMRCLVEIQYVEALNNTGLFPRLEEEELKSIHLAKHNFNREDYDRIKEIEKTVNHDVKACELFLREKLLLKQSNMIHFGLTSEDINNLAYTLLFKEFVDKEQMEQLNRLMLILSKKASQWQNIPFPARTHGQKASPSTAGKEIAVHLSRLLRQFKRLKRHRFIGKLNGATGTYAAMLAAFPDFDWLYFSCEFIERLGLNYSIATTQIEDHDTWAEYFAIVRSINNIVLDLDRDIWMYLMLGYFIDKGEKESIGSSTMPHKINPIRFENSEGNLQISNSLLDMLSNKLTTSRLQRDLSDSTVTRNVGIALSHSYLALNETINGLLKIEINESRCMEELEDSPELLAEPIQTILRAEGTEDPYTLLKDLTRGRRITYDDLNEFIRNLDVSDEIKARLYSLTVSKYTGYASMICNLVLEDARSELQDKE